MKIDTRDMVTVSDANSKGVSWLVNEASAGRAKVLIRNSKPAAVVASIEDLERLAAVDEIVDDLRLLTVTLIREVADSGKRYDLDDVAAELGVVIGDDE